MRSFYILLVYLTFLVLGTAAPFVLGLGYVWVDTFNPQTVSYSLLASLPVALIMGVACLLGYVALDRRAPPHLTSTTVLTLALAVWITATCLWAVVPTQAWSKWDPAFKVLLFSAFLPCIIRSRVQIEALLQVFVMSLAVQFVPFGLKTLISGGGYGMALGITSGNAGLNEGSTLATVCLMLVPIILFLRRHALLLPRAMWVQAMYLVLAALAVATAIGTYERTALVGLVVVAAFMWLRSRHKLLFGFALVAAGAAIVLGTSHGWNARIGTVDNFAQETSALGRLLVWRWTFDFALAHPFGGGFNAYVTDLITFPHGEDGEPLIVHGLAYHSIYFEVLGEHGWPGLALFLALFAAALGTLQGVVRRTRRVPELLWCRDLAVTLQASILTLAACGAFIGIAFQPTLYYMFAASTCLRQYVRRCEQVPVALPAARRPMRAIARAA